MTKWSTQSCISLELEPEHQQLVVHREHVDDLGPSGRGQTHVRLFQGPPADAIGHGQACRLGALGLLVLQVSGERRKQRDGLVVPPVPRKRQGLEQPDAVVVAKIARSIDEGEHFGAERPRELRLGDAQDVLCQTQDAQHLLLVQRGDAAHGRHQRPGRLLLQSEPEQGPRQGPGPAPG
jgi:hypothetical protein